MSLQLDARQRAMLAEMGLRFVLPDAGTSEPQRGVMPAPPSAPAAKPVLPPKGVSVSFPIPSAPAPAGVDAMAWDALETAVASCQACPLCASRTQTVFGVGDRQADWLIVGEAPGETEDQRGEPFVGAAGQLLDNMLRALGLDRRAKVYIVNVLKCRPPGNRNPGPEEVAQCLPFLQRQVQLLQPKVILAMGRFAVQALLGTGDAIGKLRGRVHRHQDIPVVVTYHPAYLLRNLPDKARAWADLCFAQAVLREAAAAAENARSDKVLDA